MDEAAFGALGDNPWYGRVHNPARHGYTCGGSSAGSAAAVASGEADLALGTDTLGSVRIPASYCGVVGYVPSAGRIDMAGVTPLAPSFDRVGLFTRTVSRDDCTFAAMLFDQGGSSGKPPVRGRPDQSSSLRAGRGAPAASRMPRIGNRRRFDWGALRRAMLLQIEVEAAPMLLPLPSLSEPLAQQPWSSAGTRRPSGWSVRSAATTAARRTIREWMTDRRPAAAAVHAAAGVSFRWAGAGRPGGLRDALQPARAAGDQRAGVGCAGRAADRRATRGACRQGRVPADDRCAARLR